MNTFSNSFEDRFREAQKRLPRKANGANAAEENMRHNTVSNMAVSTLNLPRSDEWDPPKENVSELGRGSYWKYHANATPAQPRWLIKRILPQVGVALMSGQWGVFKTTVALDIAVCVMAGLPFAH